MDRYRQKIYDGRMDRRTENVCIDGWMDGWTDEKLMDGYIWVDGWMDDRQTEMYRYTVKILGIQGVQIFAPNTIKYFTLVK